jgi:broad specificity phosphatase PhoE
MKKFYFVRHGATGGNEQDQFQLPTIPLSDMGLQQAEFVAERFKSLPVDVIIASDMTRAAQTADTIGKKIGKEVIHSELFREIMRPSVVRGKSKQDPDAHAIMQEVKKNFGNKDWRHSDEENFFDLKERALKALAYLTNREEQHFVVVTHGRLLSMFIGLMGFGDAFTPEQYKAIDKFFVAKNTGITIIDEHNGQYFLLTWNDYAHLGDVDIKHVYT